MILSKKTLPVISPEQNINMPDESIFNLPEKVLQFGTGVLLRGLPDYFIDKANKQKIFNGRVVIVKSTSSDTNVFDKQDGIYTLCIKGVENETDIEKYIINTSISRVLAAQTEWNKILQCATNPDLQIIISNTTETGITLMKEDNINAQPPASFPGKLLSFLHERFKIFYGDKNKGMVIVPTELITDNGKKLRDIVLELARLNNLDNAFINWLIESNYFCDSLVDRIVPGRLPEQQQNETQQKLNYEDDLMIMAEPYCLWAIESGEEKVKKILSFQQADAGVIIAPGIEKFRELKLRLLNGTHTLSCGLAFLAGFSTVKAAMENENMSAFIAQLMQQEIAPAILSNNLSEKDAHDFSCKVLDRFRNPFIEHKWLSITLQFSSKMKMRNIPVLINYHKKFSSVPLRMALGFAAHLFFMRGEKMEDGKYYGHHYGKPYLINDDNAAYYAHKWKHCSTANIAIEILRDKNFWGEDLTALPGFADAVKNYLQILMQQPEEILNHLPSEKIVD